MSISLEQSPELPNNNENPIPLNVENRDQHHVESSTLVCDQLENSKRKLRSVVWKDFKKQKIDGKDKAVCNHCGKKLGASSKNGTRHLHDHIKICPMRRQKDIRQSFLSANKTTDGKMTLGTYHFDPEFARRELANMILFHEYPLCIVEHEGFKKVTTALQPLFKPLSRNTIRNDIFKIFDIERVKTMKLLENNKSRIAITTDLWTSSHQKKGYMVVTAHFIDDFWMLQSRIIRFIYVPCPHTAESLSDVLTECLLDWNVISKLSTLTVDNCSTNDAMIKMLLDNISSSSLILGGKLFHMRCSAHILNLIVKDGLDVIAEGVAKIRDSVAYWTATPKRVEKFEETTKQLNISCNRKLVLDCKTRWNSTYLMLSSALLYKSVFSRLKQREPTYKCLPNDNDWDLAKEMCDKLILFFKVTEMFSGTKYPTANLFFPKVCEIKLSISKWLSSSCNEIRIMASKMETKFEKYWDVIHGIMVVAIVLDPRFKMKLIEYYFHRIYRETAGQEIERVQKYCYELVREYKSKSRLVEEIPPYRGPSGLEASLCEEVDPLLNFDLFVSDSSSTEHMKSEFDQYLEDGLLPRTNDFNILDWWKTNGIKYPIMFEIARDILAIPVSTVASESAFSASGRFLSPHRSRLQPKTLEALMCTQNWLGAKIQGADDLVYSAFDEDDDMNEEVC